MPGIVDGLIGARETYKARYRIAYSRFITFLKNNEPRELCEYERGRVETLKETLSDVFSLGYLDIADLEKDAIKREGFDEDFIKILLDGYNHIA